MKNLFVSDIITLTDRQSELKPGSIVPALVLGIIKHRGIHLQLPCGQVGDVYLTDLSDEYVDHPESHFSTNQFVKCCVVGEIAGARRKWAVTLRQSRFVKTSVCMKIFIRFSALDAAYGIVACDVDSCAAETCCSFFIFHQKKISEVTLT